MHYDTWVTLDDIEYGVTVEYSYTPGRKERLYLSNGDPGYPAEPAEVEVSSIVTHTGDELLPMVSDADVARIEEEIVELEEQNGRRR